AFLGAGALILSQLDYSSPLNVSVSGEDVSYNASCDYSHRPKNTHQDWYFCFQIRDSGNYGIIAGTKSKMSTDLEEGYGDYAFSYDAEKDNYFQLYAYNRSVMSFRDLDTSQYYSGFGFSGVTRVEIAIYDPSDDNEYNPETSGKFSKSGYSGSSFDSYSFTNDGTLTTLVYTSSSPDSSDADNTPGICFRVAGKYYIHHIAIAYTCS
ncbi:MAG: hypothetical protein K6B65_05775, partial [Bacilli bacterium]|nr:hypothetical protein [Bacilli bacterium]